MLTSLCNVYPMFPYKIRETIDMQASTLIAGFKKNFTVFKPVFLNYASQKHAYKMLTPLNPTFI